MTVKELREYIKNMPDETEILVKDPNEWTLSEVTVEFKAASVFYDFSGNGDTMILDKEDGWEELADSVYPERSIEWAKEEFESLDWKPRLIFCPDW